MSKTLTEQDYIEAAALLKCEVAVIKAVKEVESKGSGFQTDGKPVILFERHIFHRLTNGKFSAQYPDISNPDAGGYGKYSEQYDRLAKASMLDYDAAVKSCSWGLFQCMGLNFSLCGYSNLTTFITAMNQSEKYHLDAFCDFVIANGLDDELQRKDWAGFARGYNGKYYRKNKYDTKLQKAYDRLK